MTPASAFVFDTSYGDLPWLELLLTQRGFAPVARSFAISDLHGLVAMERPALVVFLGDIPDEAVHVRAALHMLHIPTLDIAKFCPGEGVTWKIGSAYASTALTRLSQRAPSQCREVELPYEITPALDAIRHARPDRATRHAPSGAQALRPLFTESAT